MACCVYLITQCFHLSFCQLFALVQLFDPLVQILQRRFVLHDQTATTTAKLTTMMLRMDVFLGAADESRYAKHTHTAIRAKCSPCSLTIGVQAIVLSLRRSIH